MGQLVIVVFHACNLLLVALGSTLGASRLEQEPLHADEHSAAIQTLRLLRLLKHVLQATKIGILKDFVDTIIDRLLELGSVHVLELLDLSVDLFKVLVSELLITHHLLHSLHFDLIAVLLSKLGSQMLSSTLHGQTFVSHVDSLLV